MSALRKHTIILLLLAVLVSMTVGGALSYALMMEDGSMHDCPYMGITALCNMTPLGHLSAWQQMFAAMAQSLAIFAFLLMLALLVASRLALVLFASITSPPQGIARYRYSERIADPLRLAFARGIIHSKTF